MIAEEKQDQAALYVLGALDAIEAAEFEKAIEANAELRELVRELRDAAGTIVYAAPAKSPPGDLRSRILKEISPSDEPAALQPHDKSSGISWLPWAIAAAVAIYCGVIATDRSHLRDELSSSQQTLATTQQKLTDSQQSLTDMQQNLLSTQQTLTTAQSDLAKVRASDPLADTTIISMASTPDAKVRSNGSVVWRQDKQSGLIRVSGLPKLDAARDYQLWVVDAEHKDPISAGVVRIDAQGVAEIRFKPVTSTNHPKAFAISIERKGGSERKEGPIVMLGAFNA